MDKISIETVLFYLLAGIVIISAAMVVTVKNLVRSVFLFFVTLFGLAGIYVFAMADFIAVTQVVVYVGGVLVIMLFALMLSNLDRLNNLATGLQNPVVRNFTGGIISLLFFGVVFYFLLRDQPFFGWMKTSILPETNTVKQLGVQLIGTYLLPFELISVFLLMALIGAAHIARKEQKI